MAASAPMVKLINVTKRYGSPDGANSLTVLDGISLEVQLGQSLAIVGPSGSGKSTLLHIVGTLDQPTSGQVLLEGRDVSRFNEAETAQVRNRQLGFVFQAHYLLPQCTVLENVLVPTLASANHAAAATPASNEPRQARAARLLGRVGLSERLEHRPGQLSGGERQRVALVRALINQPRLLLADEPTGALDQASAAGLTDLLIELNTEEKVTLILVTHSHELAARAQQRLELKTGHLRPLE